MKRLLMVMVLGLAAFGCSNDCDEAVDKLEECGITPDDTDTDDCDGKKACAAACTNDASCDEIKTLSDKYMACLAGC